MAGDTGSIRRSLQQFEGLLLQAEGEAGKAEAAVREAERSLACAGDAQRLVQHAAQLVQESAHRQVSDVVTHCLRAVFGPDAYEFRLAFEKKRGRTEARPAFVRGGEEVDPVAAAGGGAVDVAAFALRVACVCLSRPPLRPLLVLDEPWKHLSAGYRPQVRDLVEALAKETGIQFVIVTHSEEFEIGKVVRL